IVDGKNGSVLPIAAFTSWAAASTSRSSENVRLMLVLPRLELDVISSMPAMAEKAFSSGVATVAAIVSGLAPGRFAPTLIDGLSTVGRSLTGSLRYDTTPNTTIPIMMSVVMTGRLMNNAVMLIGSLGSTGRAPGRGGVASAFTSAAVTAAASATVAAAASTAAVAHVVRPAQTNRRIRREPRLSVSHDALAVVHAARDDRDVSGRALHHHSALAGGVTLIHHVHVRAALTRHDRLGRDHERAVLVEQMQGRRRELPGPQPAALVVEHRLELHRRRGRV